MDGSSLSSRSSRSHTGSFRSRRASISPSSNPENVELDTISRMSNVSVLSQEHSEVVEVEEERAAKIPDNLKVDDHGKNLKKAKTKKSGDSWCAIIGVTMVLVVLFSVGAFVGGYMFKKTRDPSETLPLNTSWTNSLCTYSTTQGCQGNGPKHLLVISLGAFSPSSLTENVTPALWKLRSCGSFSIALRPVFPSISITNQYSIATGLFPESHGIVDEYFRDNEVIKDTTVDGIQDPGWWKGEPVWITAKKYGLKVKVMGWKGSDTPKDGMLPDEYELGRNPKLSLAERFRKIVTWTLDPNPSLIMIHLDDFSDIARSNSMTSPAADRVLSEIDIALDRLLQQLHDRRQLSCTDIIILSDHGMMESGSCLSGDIMSILTRNIRNESVRDQDIIYFGETYGRLSLNNRSRLSLPMVTDALSCSDPNNQRMPFYLMQKKELLPLRLHYANSPRIESLIFLLRPGNILTKNPGGACRSGRNLYGYDNIYPQMHGVFLASGPSFHMGKSIKGFSVVEVYNLICAVLRIPPAPNNGTSGALSMSLLKHPVSEVPQTTPLYTNYRRAHFPATREVMVQRQERECNNNCYFSAEVDILAADIQLNISSSHADALIMGTSGFYGLPALSGGFVMDSIRLVVNREFTLGFSIVLKLPIWATFFLRTDIGMPNFIVDCKRSDVRFERGETLSCRDFDYVQAETSQPFQPRLFPSYLIFPALNGDASSTDAKMISNTVPMYQNFRLSVWQPFWEMVRGWAALNVPLHVHCGPVFDHKFPYGIVDDQQHVLFAPELRNIPLPSHFFAVITRKVTNSSSVLPDTHEQECIGFVLPHLPDISQHPCQDKDQYFLTHSAPVKDIEMLTGLRFFSGLSGRDAAYLRISQPTNLFHKSNAEISL